MEETSKKITKEMVIPKQIADEINGKIKSTSDFEKKIKEFSTRNLSEFSEILLGGAIELSASDLHVEVGEQKIKIRARIDGVLQDIATTDHKTYENLLSRIKLLSGLKLNINNRPQDGRFSVSINSLSIEIRVSTLPAEYGEAIVLRVLNPKNLINLDGLGLRKDLLTLFKGEIKKPNGMIIITGPTGSGKTTTLYAFLKSVQKPQIKIITIEDPIEYHLKGISQTQTAPEKGYDFASGLQSIMRQDPDVILVGEIRDAKTSKIAIQAALTGHLVFTTLHTNDAAGTIARLTSLGGELNNIGPAVNLVVAQRLIRKICNKCKKFKSIPLEDLKKIKDNLRGISKAITIPKINTTLKLPEPKGCKHCNQTGYQGRIGIFEAMLINDELEKFIIKNPSITDLRKEAVKRGMVTMKQDGIIKVLNGITTIEEINRVTGK